MPIANTYKVIKTITGTVMLAHWFNVTGLFGLSEVSVTHNYN